MLFTPQPLHTKKINQNHPTATDSYQRESPKKMVLPAILNRPITSYSVVVAIAAAVFLSASLLLSSFILRIHPSLFCSLPSLPPPSPPNDLLLPTLLHYATSPLLPQQSRAEISLSFNLLRRRSPCTFLVFGLGHDSPMWSAFNPGGTTLFLEEDPKWSQSVLRNFPSLAAHTVRYPTKLSDADDLLRAYRSQPACLPPIAHLKGNKRCRLALSDLPDEIYETEWDVIMIDAPRGFFAEAPGRMGAIYSAAVMARARKGDGVTDVFLHDVERPVERSYGMEFLCKKYLVEESGRLWHFRIPPVKEGNKTSEGKFC